VGPDVTLLACAPDQGSWRGSPVFDPPPIEFAVRDGFNLAYQVAGDGPTEIVYVAGSTAMSQSWQDSDTWRGLRRLGSFSRLVTFDQRGTGYSDRFDPAQPLTLEHLVADLEAVVEAAGVEEPVLVGTHNGGAVAAVYATRHPVRRLVLCNTWARLEEADDFPIGFSGRILDRMEERYRTEWGRGTIYNQYAPRRAGARVDLEELESTSRNQLIAIYRSNRTYDIRHLLPFVSTPTLVIHFEDNVNIPAAHGHYIAEHIPGARLVLLPGSDQDFLRNHATPVIDEVERFVTGRLTEFTDRVRTTMLFTDIVGSTPLAASLGDEAWSALVDQHNERVRREILAHGGEEVKCTGDGFLVAFDDPVAAVRCALATVGGVTELGLEIRAGVHLGEVFRMDRNDVGGLAVHFAQRLSARAEGEQVLTSAAVREACEGSGLAFADRGRATFKGIAGKWEIFEARG